MAAKTAKTATASTHVALLEQVSFVADHRCFKKGRTLTFQPGVNLLVGDQGVGKSTVLQLIYKLASKDEWERKDASKVIAVKMGQARCRIVWFDFEKSNPRTLSYLLDEGIGFQVASMFASHGETVNQILASIPNNGDPALVLLDEPDTALSPRSAHKLARRFQEIADGGHQILAAVHNPIVIASQAKVYSLEHKRWMKSETFLAAHAAE